MLFHIYKFNERMYFVFELISLIDAKKAKKSENKKLCAIYYYSFFI